MNPTLFQKPFFGRARELLQLKKLIERPSSGFVDVRGRRRIGKSALLKRFAESYKGDGRIFYFSGRDDETTRNCQRRFAQEWDRSTGVEHFSNYKVSKLSWDFIFEQLAAIYLERKLVIILDEIQWISKHGVGFCGLIKSFWENHKHTRNLTIIISGSSTSFFHQHVDGEMATLRGLKTHSSIWVPPFSLHEVETFYFPYWSKEDICLLYMFVGGVPYYLENVNKDRNFIRAMNATFCVPESIFLEEVDAVLKVETRRKSSLAKLKKIISCLGQDGSTEKRIVEKTNIAQPNVNEVLGRLLDWGLVKERYPYGANKENAKGTRYYLPDPYLNFYFQILWPLSPRIQANTQGGILFNSQILASKSGYYIPNFTGKAFELLCMNLLEMGQIQPHLRTAEIFRKLSLEHVVYSVGTYWKQAKTQIDIVVQSDEDREARIVECKWVSHLGSESQKFLGEVKSKEYTGASEDFSGSYHLVVSQTPPKSLTNAAADEAVTVIELEDLF